MKNLRFIQLFLVLFSVILLSTGCDHNEGNLPMNDYVTRLGRALNVDHDGIPPGAKLHFPRVRDLRREFATNQADLLDFLALSDCQLQQVVAERNSSLGRVADASGLLRFDLEFLRYGGKCIEQLATEEPELTALLSEVMEIKRSQLPARIWQATLGGAEFRQFWQATWGTSLNADSLRTIQQLSVDIDRWLLGDYRGYEDLDRRLGIIAESSGGGIVATWSALDRGLAVADTIIQRQSHMRRLCYPEMQPPQAAEIFHNVVSQRFIGDIQRTISATNRATHELMPPVHRMENMLLGAEPDAYTDWRIKRDAAISEGRQALLDHVAALAPLMQQCGYLPR